MVVLTWDTYFKQFFGWLWVEDLFLMTCLMLVFEMFWRLDWCLSITWFLDGSSWKGRSVTVYFAKQKLSVAWPKSDSNLSWFKCCCIVKFQRCFRFWFVRGLRPHIFRHEFEKWEANVGNKQVYGGRPPYIMAFVTRFWRIAELGVHWKSSGVRIEAKKDLSKCTTS